MKLSTNHVRTRMGINPEGIKRLVTLEDEFFEGKVSKDMIFELSDLYSRFTDYLEYLRDPMKLYFQAKIEGLFQKKIVMKTIIEEQNKTNEGNEVEILSQDFLNFSDIYELKESRQSVMRPIDSRVSRFINPTSRFKPKTDVLMMFKVNDEMNKKKNQESFLSTNRETFEENDSLIKESLESQEIELSKKLRQRRNKVLEKENSNRSKMVTYSTKRIASFEQTPIGLLDEDNHSESKPYKDKTDFESKTINNRILIEETVSEDPVIDEELVRSFSRNEMLERFSNSEKCIFSKKITEDLLEGDDNDE